MPELPGQKQARYTAELGLSEYDAVTLTASRAMTDYFEAALAAAGADKAKPLANWLLGEFSASLNRDDKTPAESPIAPALMAALVKRVVDGTLNNKTGKSGVWGALGKANTAMWMPVSRARVWSKFPTRAQLKK